MPEEAKKVYVVTEGDYSSYHIEGVFSSRYRAGKLLRLLKHEQFSTPRIETWELDTLPETFRTGVLGWQADCDGNGQIVHINGRRPDGENELFVDDRPQTAVKYLVYVTAKTEEQARKIVQDLVAQYRAEKEGITDG